jgi:hypothetical protein
VARRKGHSLPPGCAGGALSWAAVVQRCLHDDLLQLLNGAPVGAWRLAEVVCAAQPEGVAVPHRVQVAHAVAGVVHHQPAAACALQAPSRLQWKRVRLWGSDAHLHAGLQLLSSGYQLVDTRKGFQVLLTCRNTALHGEL